MAPTEAFLMAVVFLELLVYTLLVYISSGVGCRGLRLFACSKADQACKHTSSFEQRGGSFVFGLGRVLLYKASYRTNSSLHCICYIYNRHILVS